MTVVILGLDALDPDLVDEADHPNLTLSSHAPIETIPSHTGEPSTHELWPTIITGLRPEDHGLVLSDDGVAWGNPILRYGSKIADYVLPASLQTRIGEWILTNTTEDAFRTSAEYYEQHGIETLFDGHASKPIGVPNYVTDTGAEDREHTLRQNMGTLFERDSDATGGHRTSDAGEFYEQCLEMAMVRIARMRRALRSGRFEVIFGYTSALDLVGHVAHDRPAMHEDAMREVDEFVGELVSDLDEDDDLLIVSDHGLQGGVHTMPAMVAGTDPEMVDAIESVVDVKAAVQAAVERGNHTPEPREYPVGAGEGADAVQEQLESLGYM